MSGDVARFYKDRAKTFKTDEKRFDYDEDGNMVERTKNDDGQYVVSKTIALPSYRPLHYEERDTMERDRQTAIADPPVSLKLLAARSMMPLVQVILMIS